MKTKILMLAVTLQALKCKNIVSAPSGDDKMAKILFPRCAAMIKREKQCFQVTLQALKSKITTIKEQFFLFNTLKAFHDD